MKIDTRTMDPWAEINTILSRMETLTVKVGDVTYAGMAELTRDEATGDVVLEFDPPKVEGAAVVKKKAAK